MFRPCFIVFCCLNCLMLAIDCCICSNSVQERRRFLQSKALKSASSTQLAASSASRKEPVRLAYLVSEYPAVSHTFILREVRRLRTMNLDVRVASINSPGQPLDEMAVEDR